MDLILCSTPLKKNVYVQTGRAETTMFALYILLAFSFQVTPSTSWKRHNIEFISSYDVVLS